MRRPSDRLDHSDEPGRTGGPVAGSRIGGPPHGSERRRRRPTRVDSHVGARLRDRRRQLSMSQAAFGDALGITFQQVHKYERGVDRLSASALWRAAQVLEVPVGYFFDGLPRRRAAAPLGEPHPGADLVRDLDALAPPLRRLVMRVLETLSRP
jgi:transcriptional regulator with XRE-family HTH domain